MLINHYTKIKGAAHGWAFSYLVNSQGGVDKNQLFSWELERRIYKKWAKSLK
ncbi:MAG: hypothetical protein WAV55_02080 [Clostridiaceae bacterium]